MRLEQNTLRKLKNGHVVGIFRQRDHFCSLQSINYMFDEQGYAKIMLATCSFAAMTAPISALPRNVARKT